MKKILITALILAISIVTNSCNEELFFPEDIRNSLTAPEIHSFEPQRGSIGTEIVISGRSLSSAIRAYIGDIGENPVEIVQRFTDYSLVLRIVGTEVTGPITIVNNIGPTTTTEEFYVVQNIPNVTLPLTLEGGGELTRIVDGQHIEITGEQMSAIRRVTFGENYIAGRLIDRDDARIIVEMPYLDVDNGTYATINIEYMAHGSLQTPSIDTLLVENPPIVFEITNLAAIPEQTNPNRAIILRGPHMNRVTEVFLSDQRDSTWTIISQSRNELRVLVPGFTAPETTGYLTLVHSRPREYYVIGTPIEIANPDAWNFVFFRDVILNVNRFQGEEGEFNGNENFNNFFGSFLNARGDEVFEVFSPCDYQTVAIDSVTMFFFSITGNAIRLENPAHAAGTVFNIFRCAGENVLSDTRGIRHTRFRRLEWQTNETDARLRDQALAGVEGRPGAFESLHANMLRVQPASNVPTWRGSTNAAITHENWDVGDVLSFREFAGADDQVGGRIGFIHIANVLPGPNFDPANPQMQPVHDRQESTVIVNIWFQREAE